MFLGRILGTVVATTKSEGLMGKRMCMFEPVDENKKAIGEAMVAIDTVSCRDGDIIAWVASREASLACDPWFVPVDAAIVGIIDDLNGEAL